MEEAHFEVVQREGRRDTRGRRIESEKEKVQLLEQYDGSGLTQKAFARREGINYHTFVSWLQQRRMRLPAPKAAAFAEYRLERPGAIPAAALEVRLPDGTIVRGGEAAAVAALIKALRD